MEHIKLPKLEGYVIFDPESGLFSRGRMCGYGKWQKKGKIWSSMRAVHCHLAQYIFEQYSYEYLNFKIKDISYINKYDKKEAYVVDLTNGDVVASVKDIIDELIAKRKKKRGIK